MPGVDGFSVGRFGRMAQAGLRGIQARMASGAYRADPLRLAEMEKKSGGGRRLLLVPTVRERVAQGAVARWLGAKWNPRFDPASFAYRPGLGVHDALRALARLRDQGYRWVLDADIRSFFDSIDHSILLAKLEAWLGKQSPLLQWIREWVAAPIWDGTEVTRLGCGVPQGSPLSPLLANYYLDDFDRTLRAAGMHLVRYADDFLVLTRTPFELSDFREVVEKALRDLDLTLNPEKTRTTTFERRFTFLGAEIQGNSIFLPFEKAKTQVCPVFVAPLMPPALLRAFREGHLRPKRVFQWAAQASPANRNCAPEASPVRKRALLCGISEDLRTRRSDKGSGVLPGVTACDDFILQYVPSSFLSSSDDRG